MRARKPPIYAWPPIGTLVVIALIAATIAALQRDRWTDTYFIATGPDYEVVDRDAFERAVAAHRCLPTSEVTRWADTHETQHICEQQ